MKTFKTIFNGLIVITGLVAGVSLTAMQKEELKAKITAKITPAPAWYQKALELKITSPLKVKVINYTGSPVKTIQQGQGNIWWANIPNGNTFEDEAFNLDKFTAEYPQYTIRTAKNIYALNFEKNPSYFKAVLERLLLQPMQPTSGLSDNEIMQLVKIVAKDPVQEIDQIQKGNALTVILDENAAQMVLTND